MPSDLQWLLCDPLSPRESVSRCHSIATLGPSLPRILFKKRKVTGVNTFLKKRAVLHRSPSLTLFSLAEDDTADVQTRLALKLQTI